MHRKPSLRSTRRAAAKRAEVIKTVCLSVAGTSGALAMLVAAWAWGTML